jgi:CRISPR-associated endonuclease Cas1
MVSLAAMRWLADQDVSLAMLDRRGFVLATTGPVSPSDARLRRAQALAPESGAALRIVRELIGQKLSGQERIVRDKLNNSSVAEIVARANEAVAEAQSVRDIHLLETQGAGAYWSAWHTLAVTFPRRDVERVPVHWRTFGTRRSPLTASPRLAVNPPNAILNYLYSVVESEARLAASALGLDPGLGFLHKDTPGRDSLACDLMEPVRPLVDAFLLDWITRSPLRREWFFEQRDGNCRLMGTFAAQLSETAPMWARAIAPIAEGVARTLSSALPRIKGKPTAPTRLTQDHKREAKGRPPLSPVEVFPRPPAVCRICGASIEQGVGHCASCARVASKEALIEAAKLGRIAGHSLVARARQAEKQRQHAVALKAWNPLNQPNWLTEKVYRLNIQPRLAGITVPVISSTLGVSEPYAALIRVGRCLPHPRHWRTLARLAGVWHD